MLGTSVPRGSRNESTWKYKIDIKTNFLNGNCPLFGWLFFYFGKNEIGVLIDEKITLYNKQKVEEK